MLWRNLILYPNRFLVMSFCVALPSALDMTDAAQWQLIEVFIEPLKLSATFSNELPQHTTNTVSLSSFFSQYFFCLLLIFLIELVAGVLAYVYYQRVDDYYLKPLLNYCCSLNNYHYVFSCFTLSLLASCCAHCIGRKN